MDYQRKILFATNGSRLHRAARHLEDKKAKLLMPDRCHEQHATPPGSMAGRRALLFNIHAAPPPAPPPLATVVPLYPTVLKQNTPDDAVRPDSIPRGGTRPQAASPRPLSHTGSTRLGTSGPIRCLISPCTVTRLRATFLTTAKCHAVVRRNKKTPHFRES